MHAGNGLQFPGPSLSFPHHSPLPPPHSPWGWALFPPLPASGTGGCDVAGGTPGWALVSTGLPLSRSPGMAGEAPLWPSSLDVLLVVWRSFPAGLGVAEQTQGVKRLLKPPAAIFARWCPGGTHPVLGTGVRGYRDECGLGGGEEAESRPLKASWREPLCAGSRRMGRVSPREGVLCGGHWGYQSPQVAEGRACPQGERAARFGGGVHREMSGRGASDQM